MPLDDGDYRFPGKVVIDSLRADPTAQSRAPYKWDDNMFSLNEVTRRIENQICASLAFSNLCYKNQYGSDGEYCELRVLYSNVRAFVPNEVTAGLFNKVIDDMSRIGLLKVDRKNKTIVNIRWENMPRASDLKVWAENPKYGWLWLAKLYREDMTPEQAKDIVERAIAEQKVSQ